MSDDLILELRGITKIFPGVKALNGVSFELRRGEVHALMGENGAGKSTFIKVITGVFPPEEGQIFLDGKEVSFKSTRDSLARGIAAVYQHPTTYPDLSVTENIFMGHQIKKGPIMDWKAMHRKAAELLGRLNADFDPKSEMGTLSVAQQQMVEIAKALSTDARIIILDEPTASLTANESKELYRIVKQLRDEGVSIIFISHRMEDMYELADRVTVFRDAQYIGTYDVDGITTADLVKAMVGREIKDMYPKPHVEIGEEVLRIDGLSRVGYFKDVSLNVHAGEIVGLTGLVGARRTEVMECVCGITKPSAGSVFLNGKKLSVKRPKDAMNAGIVLLPEDRHKEGLILSWGLGDNVTLPVQDEIAKGHIFNNNRREREMSRDLLESVDTKAVTIFDPASSLSGGNQQKVVVAKSLAQNGTKVIILDEPTKGVDVGAKAEIYAIIGELVRKGYAIIMISSEMPEILGMCDRVYVMCSGRVTGCLDIADADQEKILHLAMLEKRKEAAEA